MILDFRFWIFDSQAAPQQPPGSAGVSPERIGKRTATQRTGLLRLLLAACAALLVAGSARAAITITRTSSPIFYSDIGHSLDAMYVSYQITNGDAVAYPSVYATISNFTGGVVSLAGGDSGAHALGSLAPGQTKTAFFFLKATAGTATAQTHTITVLNGPAGIGSALATQNFSFTSVDDTTIKALANKVTTIVTGPNPPTVGGIVTVTVTGQTGTIGAAEILSFTPAAFSTWRADAFALVSTNVTLSGGNSGSYNDTLLLPPPASTANTDYVATYTFKTVNTTAAPTQVSPVGYISSGTQVKHTDTGNFGSFAPINPPVNTTVLGSKTANPSALANAGTVTYTLHFTNSGANDATLDRIVDTLPSSPGSPTYVAGTSKFNGAAFADPSINGRVLTWAGTFLIPAGSSRDFVYNVSVPAARGSYVNSAVGFVESTQIDTTLNTSDNAPAQATVTVASADVAVTKTGPASTGANTTFSYTINYVNNGPDAAANVIVKDTLPGAVTFLSASNGGTLSGGVVTWPAIASLANGASGSYTVTVRAPLSGSVVNTASSTADTGDPTPGNNDGSAAGAKVTTTITPLADVATTVSGPATVLPNATFTYTVTATNNGPSPATSVVISDTLPAQVTFLSASNGGTLSGGVVTWPSIASIASGSNVSYTVTVIAPASGTFTNKVSSTSATVDPTASNNDGSAGASQVTTTVGGVNVTGFVYNDANHNIQMDATESGTGLTLYAKLVSSLLPSGPALQAASVDSATGAYAFSNVGLGTYTIVINGDNVLANVTPAVPAGWSGTEFPSQTRSVSVTSIDVPNQNFGLIHALTLSGRVFADNGAGGGTANDGALNGGEGGIAGVTVKLTDTTGATVYDTATTDGAGNYSLLVPNTLANGTQLKVTETNLASYVSTGASTGNTGGSYARASDTITFAFASGTTYTGVNFGDVAAFTFAPDNAQAGLPGSAIVYAHTFTANSAGQVTFSIARTSSPALSGWSSALYLDVNGNSQLDSGDTAINGPIALAAGQTIQILVKEFIPVGAPLNAQDKLTVTASFSYTNASPALTSSAARTDITTVGNPTSAGLVLLKSVDKTTARPGDTIAYTINYSNNSSDNLTNVIIYDNMPAFTTFASASNGALPSGLTGVTLTAPAVGATGPIRWTFAGSLAPGASGTVTFHVTLDQ
jgi:uncharacterized repeat protein (TIGR01451 family)